MHYFYYHRIKYINQNGKRFEIIAIIKYIIVPIRILYYSYQLYKLSVPTGYLRLLMKYVYDRSNGGTMDESPFPLYFVYK